MSGQVENFVMYANDKLVFFFPDNYYTVHYRNTPYRLDSICPGLTQLSET